MSQDEHFIVVDGHALIYRAYHAFPGLTTPTGQLINAVFGFTKILLAVIADFRPMYVGVAFDHPKPTFRHEAYTAYKGTRAEMPEDLKPQIEIVKKVVTALNMPIFEVPGYEADDLIGSVAHQAEEMVNSKREPRLQTLIVTGDRDTLQLVTEHVRVWMPGRGKGQGDMEYDREGVKFRMGVYPEQVIDLKALMGDASDNIPGVKGIGQKTATALIQAFGTLEGVYQAVAEVEKSSEPHPILKGAILTKLQVDKDNAYLSKELATINIHSPITLDLAACHIHGFDKEQVAYLFNELGFKSLIPLLPADDFELGIQDALF